MNLRQQNAEVRQAKAKVTDWIRQTRHQPQEAPSQASALSGAYLDTRVRQAAGSSVMTVDAIVRAREAHRCGRTASSAARAGPPPFVKSESDPIMRAASQPSLPSTHPEYMSRSSGSEERSVTAWLEGGVPNRGRKNSLDELQDGLASFFGNLNLFGADGPDANSAAGTQAAPDATVVIGPDSMIQTLPATLTRSISPVEQQLTGKNSSLFTSDLEQGATPRSSGPTGAPGPEGRIPPTVPWRPGRITSPVEPDWVLKAQQAVEKARMISAQGAGSGM